MDTFSVFPSRCSLHQRPQHSHDLTILDMRGVSELLSVFLPHSFQFRAFFNVEQNGGDIRDLLCCPAMVCGCLQRIRKHHPVEFLGCCQNIGIVEICAGIFFCFAILRILAFRLIALLTEAPLNTDAGH